MNHQVNAVFQLCDGYVAELEAKQAAEAAHQQRFNDCADLYRAELIDAVLKGAAVAFGNSTMRHDPAGIIADEMNEGDLQNLVITCLQYKAGQTHADLKVGS